MHTIHARTRAHGKVGNEVSGVSTCPPATTATKMMKVNNMNDEGLTKLRRLAVAWFDESDWQAWRAIDANFPPDFDYWRQRMQTTLTRLESAGVPVFKVIISPSEFLAWSKENGCGVGSSQRAHYAAMKASSMDLH
jgi:hypothetical protein